MQVNVFVTVKVVASALKSAGKTDKKNVNSRKVINASLGFVGYHLSFSAVDV